MAFKSPDRNKQHPNKQSRLNRYSGSGLVLLLLSAAGLSACQGVIGDSNSSGPGFGSANGGASSIDATKAAKDKLDQELAAGVPAPFDPASVESAAYRVKMLISGELPTAEELAQLEADDSSLRLLVDEWMKSPSFTIKLKAFFIRYWQQTEGSSNNELGATLAESAGINMQRPLLNANLEESLARTALHIFETGGSISDLVTRNSFMATTAMLQYLSYVDAPRAHWKTTKYVRYNLNNGTFPANPTVDQMIANNAWKVPGDLGLCDGQLDSNLDTLFTLFLGRFRDGSCSPVEFSADYTTTPVDFTDWRMVTFTQTTDTADTIHPAKVDLLRKATELKLTQPRVGFFTTPAFLVNWPSNIDNSFRVTVNQSLITALGVSFDDNDVTVPLKSEAIGTEHAGPGTECYGCHRYLDPMKNYFVNEWDPDFYSRPVELPAEPTAFAFFGHSIDSGSISTFAEGLATHPFFGKAWVNKMCYFASSTPCDESDPEFQRIVSAFEKSNFNFRELLIELYSSPLVTGISHVKSHDTYEYLVSIARNEHWCRALSVRLEVDNACALSSTLSAGIPADSWSRGSTSPTQAATPSLFYSATVESFCGFLATRLVGGSVNRYSLTDPAATLPAITKDLIGPEGSERYNKVLALLEEHIALAEEAGVSRNSRMRSAFTLACSTAYSIGVGL